ncbi:MAG: HlyD family efflux transporter periplasmic adaptor subunit [Defluviitaleaceae bacterium]|nr:HlyD family efflux transporter periplasmic adaptor subunit [Defluviitaleaceae bacterium]
MKKKVKYAILILIVLAVGGAVVFTAMQPLHVDTVIITPSYAEAYFTERGHVQDDRHVTVYALTGGVILSVNVQEGQFVEEGDILAVIDPSDFLHEIQQLSVSNQSIYAQIDNLAAEEARMRVSQTASRNALQGELNAIAAQEQIARVSETDGLHIREENIRLQNILIEQSRIDVQNAQDELDRAQLLFNAGIIPRVEVDAAEQVLEGHNTMLQTNEQRLEIISSEAGIVDQSEHFAALRSATQAQIAGIETTLNQLNSEPMRQHFLALIEGNNLAIANLERMVNSSTITSPVSGIIDQLHVDSTNILNPARPVAEIITGGDNFIEVFVSTANINDLSVGDTVDLIFIRQGGDVVYSGTIYSIGNRAEAMVSILGVEERRVEVLIEPNTSSDSFRSGFDVDVRFVTYAAENRITVPRTAIFEDAGQSMVYVVENGTTVARPVVLGTQLRTEVVIESGINDGDVVIRNARQDGLAHGISVAY